MEEKTDAVKNPDIEREEILLEVNIDIKEIEEELTMVYIAPAFKNIFPNITDTDRQSKEE